MSENVWKAAMSAMQSSLTTMKVETDGLKAENTKLNKMNTILEQENHTLKKKGLTPATSSLEMENMKVTVDSLKVENAMLKEQRNTANTEPEVKAEIRRLKETVADLQSENAALRNKVVDGSGKKSEDGENGELLQTYQTTITKLQSENKQNAREISILVGKFRKAETARVQFMTENELMKAEMKTMTETVKKAESDRDKIRQMLQDVTRMHAMKGDDKDSQITSLEERLASLDKIILKSSQDVKEKGQKIERLMTAIDELRNDLQVSEREKEILRKDVKDKEDRVESLRKEVQRAIEDREGLISSLDGDKQKEAHTLERLMNQLEKATSEKEGYKKQKEDLESKKLELESRLNVEREELQRAEQERENLRRERAELQKRMAKLEDEGSERQADIEKLTRDNESLMSQNTKLSARVDSLKKENNKLNAELDDLSDEVAVLTQTKGDISKNRELVTRYEDESRELRSKVADLSTKLESTEDAAKMYKESSKEKARQLAKMKEQFSGSGAELSKLKVKLEILEAKHEKLEEENNELVEIAKEKNRQNQESIGEVSNLKLQNLMLMKELNFSPPSINLDDMSDGSDSKIKELTAQIKKLKEENKRLRATLTMKDMTEANYISEMTQLQNQIQKKEAELKKSETTLRKQRDWVDDIIYDKVKNEKNQLVKGIEKFSSISLPNIQRAALVSSPQTTKRFSSDSKLGPRSRMQGGYMKNFKKR